MIICVDWRDRWSRSWQKKWDDLGGEIQVASLDDLSEMELTATSLVLVHASAFNNMTADLPVFKDSLLSRYAGCLGIVTAGSQQRHEVMNDGRVCLIHTPFPPELRHLATRVNALHDALIAALRMPDSTSRKDALIRAWDVFDHERGEDDTLVALAILCQGFLAVYAGQTNDQATWHSTGVLQALVRMGWIRNVAEPASCDGTDLYEVAPEVASLRISQELNTVQEPRGYWLDIFRHNPQKDDTTVLAGLETALTAQWDKNRAGDFSAITRLLRRLKESTLADSEAPMEVAEAYCAIADQLGPG